MRMLWRSDMMIVTKLLKPPCLVSQIDISNDVPLPISTCNFNGGGLHFAIKYYIFVIGIRCEKRFVYHLLLASLTPYSFFNRHYFQASQRTLTLRGLLFYIYYLLADTHKITPPHSLIGKGFSIAVFCRDFAIYFPKKDSADYKTIQQLTKT